MLGVARECGVKYLRVMKYCMFGLFEPKKKKGRIRPRGKPSAVVICEIVLVVMAFNLQSKQQYQLQNLHFDQEQK